MCIRFLKRVLDKTLAFPRGRFTKTTQVFAQVAYTGRKPCGSFDQILSELLMLTNCTTQVRNAFI